MEKTVQKLPNGVLVHTYRIPAEGVKKKVLYHFSDVHLTEYDALSDEAEKAVALEETANWENLRLYFANENNEPCAPEQQIPTGVHFTNLLAVAEEGDALVLAGDICNTVNGANLRVIDAALRQVSVPYLSVAGNHEPLEQLPDGHPFALMKTPVQVLDLGDLVLLGFEDSRQQITREQIAILREYLAGEKPLILAMHIPLLTEGNRAKLEKCGDYFQLNKKDASAEITEFVELIKQHPGKILALLAGHLHFADTTEIAPGIPQYVSSQGALGNINRYEIGG